MVEIRNPNKPATARQLWKLHELTGKDTRDWKLTIEEASQKIDALKGGVKDLPTHKKCQWNIVPPEWKHFIDTPMSAADMRLLFGDQGKGKSITSIACMIDDYYYYLTHIVSPEGELIKAHALNAQEQRFLEAPIKQGGLGIRYDHLKHIRIFNDKADKSKIIAVPQSYLVLSPVKLFANRTLFGVRSMTIGFEDLIAYINTPLMTNGWITFAESVMVDKRDTMSNAGKFTVWFGAEARKRHMRVIIDSQYPSMVQSRFHLFATTRVECDYDPETMMVSLDVNKNSPYMSSTSYYSQPFYGALY